MKVFGKIDRLFQLSLPELRQLITLKLQIIGAKLPLPLLKLRLSLMEAHLRRCKKKASATTSSTSTNDQFKGIQGSMSFDWRKLASDDIGHWHLMLDDQTGKGHPVFNELDRYLNGLPDTECWITRLLVDVSRVCVRNVAGLHEETSFNEISFSDGILFIRTSEENRHGRCWRKVITLMDFAFLSPFFTESGTTIQIDLRALQRKASTAVLTAA